MFHPVLTIVFDTFLVGSTLLIIAGIAAEGRGARRPRIGARPPQAVRRRERLPATRLSVGCARRGITAGKRASVRSW